MTDWHAVLGTLAGLIQLGAFFPYIRDILYGTTRPNVVSYGLWSLASGIAAAAQIIAGPSWSVLFVISASLGALVVAVLAASGWGYGKLGFTEVVCLFFSLIALFLWRITQDPVVAIIFAVAADGTAYVPTIVKAYRDPFSELPIFWFMLIVVGLLSIFSTTKLDSANLIFPIYYFFINTICWGVVFFGQRLKTP